MMSTLCNRFWAVILFLPVYALVGLIFVGTPSPIRSTSASAGESSPADYGAGPRPARPPEFMRAKGEGAIEFTLLWKTKFRDASDDPIYPKELQQLAGKTVRLRGFMAPYDDPDNMQTFLLVGNPSGCFFCNPPALEDVVGVRQAGRHSTDYLAEPIEVEGTLKLRHTEVKDPMLDSVLFVIDQARINRVDMKN